MWPGTESGLQKKRKRDENKGPNQVTREKKSKRIPFISMNTDFLNGNESHNSESDGRSCYTVGYDGDGDDEVGYDGYDSLHVDTHTDLESRMLYKQVRLNAADRTNFVKVSSDGSEVRNDSTSFGSIRANCYISAVDRYTTLCPCSPASAIVQLTSWTVMAMPTETVNGITRSPCARAVSCRWGGPQRTVYSSLRCAKDKIRTPL